MRKKAQIKMFETIAVIIVFFFILVFGMVYYNSTQIRELERMKSEDSQLRAIEIIKTVTYLPELECSKTDSNCIDLLKLQNFEDFSEGNKLYYYNIFFSSNISVRQLYPAPDIALGEKEEYQIYYNPNNRSRSTVSSFIPVLIYDPLNKKYRAGVLQVELYQ